MRTLKNWSVVAEARGRLRGPFQFARMAVSDIYGLGQPDGLTADRNRRLTELGELKEFTDDPRHASR
jgi:hypothetical protein